MSVLPSNWDSLLHRQGYIGGQWRESSSGATFAVLDPADRRLICEVADMGADDARAAVDAAEASFPAWRDTLVAARSAILLRWRDLIMAEADALAALMTREQGKPFKEARAEVVFGASFLEWFAEDAKRLNGEIIPTTVSGRQMMAFREPIGIAAAITPWNFPIAMITRKCGAALAAGCPIVVKPAEETPLSALALAALGERAGIPAGVLNVVPSNQAAEVGAVLTGDERVRIVSFTGSTEVGRLLMRQSSSTVKKMSLELGGNAPFVIFADADLDAAIEGLVANKFRNGGQTCVCANRVLVERPVFDAVVERLAAAVGRMRIGAGFEDGVDVGPLINEDALVKVERLVADAVSRGARVVCGGRREGNIYLPTILTGVTPDMACVREEIFGPVACLMEFEGEDAAMDVANGTPFGLAAYVFTRDHSRIWRIIPRLDFGLVGINEGLMSTAVAPFGGVKQSGLGREGGREGLLEFTETKYVALSTR